MSRLRGGGLRGACFASHRVALRIRVRRISIRIQRIQRAQAPKRPSAATALHFAHAKPRMRGGIAMPGRHRAIPLSAQREEKS
ncbi:hypothetical protein NX868_06890 [Burkholderia thailandensis]|uniref:hypothetical protein n=1 Tax=Burkholderia thailandensis TaxID=57975 RepID=UPI0003109D86|nr:hypothetical protein [Burkholderia thailandensis]MCS3395403.1 hypothetical protein [Burkholderia thailandensis]MCS6456791.1 hypothetical protein [Burkholderia thailandensis]MCS6464241.1 hypothetical protein [Burkholderia thailandensis]MCS6482008.1 hypothetical protein [Burkholderia thailandensis]MCS6492368.1 hypothetical protein [Burkholderia thailandensis]